MSELRECPFCGGEASVYESNRWPSSGNRITGYTVVCTDMDCINYRADDWYERTEKRATERWNTRAERTCVPRVVPRSFSGDSEPSFYQAICDCGWIVGEDGASSLSDFEHIDTYCGGCGAKVVAE